MDSILKTGGSSIVMGEKFFSGTFGKHSGKVLKISNITTQNDETKYVDIISTIDNFNYYYIIPNDLAIVIKPTSDFYNFIKGVVNQDELNIFKGNLYGYFVDYGGNKDLLDTFNDIEQNPTESIWSSYNDILVFAKHIIEGISFLNSKEIAHLDIKPENIMVNCKSGWIKNFRKSKHYFKIIDFGFASKYPFDDYVSHTRGTPGYLPRNLKIHGNTPFLPKIVANDFKLMYNRNFPLLTHREFVYKIDSFCFGRVLYFLRYLYENNRIITCFDWSKKSKTKLDILINELIEPNVYNRRLPSECLELF